MKVTEQQDIRKELEAEGYDDDVIRDVIAARIAVARAKARTVAESREANRQIRKAKAAAARHDLKYSCPQSRADKAATELPPAERGEVIPAPLTFHDYTTALPSKVDSMCLSSWESAA